MISDYTTLNQKELLKEIVDLSYKILIKKLGNGSLKALNEAAFQLEFGHILKTIGNLYEFSSEDKFHLEFESILQLSKPSNKSKTKKARIDILLTYKDENQSTTAAIELKFFKKANHREPNNRYDVFNDISNLEAYQDHGVDMCYFILATDHNHYCYQESYSKDTADFDFRDGSHYQKGRALVYNTAVPYGNPIVLKNSYYFKWLTINNLFFLKVDL